MCNCRVCKITNGEDRFIAEMFLAMIARNYTRKEAMITRSLINSCNWRER